MEKLILSLLLIIALVSALPAVADEGSSAYDPERKVSDEMIEILSGNLDSLFPITSQKEYFNTPEQALYSDNGPETVIEKSNDRGKRLIRIFQNADGIHDHMAYETIETGYPTDFHLTMDVTTNDAWPLNESGCFLGFTNYGVSAYGDAEMVGLLTDARNAGIYHREWNGDSGELFTLETRGKSPMKMTVVHLTGHTYVYIDGKYAGQLHDGMTGPLRLMYGAAVLKNGDSAGCTFDNLVIRKLGN